MSHEEIIKAYLMREFFPDEPAEFLDESTALLSDGLLDSIGVSKLVSFLSGEFGVEFAAHELDDEYLDGIRTIADLVRRKIRDSGR